MSITIASDIGGVFKDVTAFPAGFANDGGITGVEINGIKAIRTKRGSHNCEEVGIFADGTDQTARINAVFAHAKVKKVRFETGAGGTVVVNGAVNAQGKVLEVMDGTMFGGTGSITNFKLYADDTCQCVSANFKLASAPVNDPPTTTTLTFTPSSFSGKTISPYWFGMKPNTDADMTGPMQKAVNLAANSGKINTVFVPGGVYDIKDLLLMKTIGAADTGQCSVSIIGAHPSGVQGVTFRNLDRNSATIHFMRMHGCNIENIRFEGGIPQNENFITGSWNPGGTVRLNRKTPSCACAIDDIYTGFQSTLTPSDYYPGVPVEAYNNTYYNGSTNIRFINCGWHNHYVAIANGLSGAPNQEGIVVEGGFFSNVHTFWAAGQLNSRENVIRDLYGYWLDTFMSNENWGSGLGDLPVVVNCNICIFKYLFKAVGDFTTIRFKGLYCETAGSLGISRGNCAVRVEDCNWTFYHPEFLAGQTLADMPVFIQANGPFEWTGGKIDSPNYIHPMVCNCPRGATFASTFIRASVPVQSDPLYFDRINFENCAMTYAGGVNPLQISDGDTNLMGYADESDHINKHILPGSKIKTRTGRTYTGVGKKIDRLAGSAGRISNASTWYVFTKNEANNTLSFTPDTTGRFLVGDMIVSDEPISSPLDDFDAVPGFLGYVSAITGGVVTLNRVPLGIPGGNYSPYIARVPVFIPRTIGSITAGQTLVTNVLKESASFGYGSRVKGRGIQEGTYITGITADTFTLSVPAYETHLNNELYDAETKVTADNKPFFLFGGNYNLYLLPTVWFKGDEIFNVTGEPGYRSLYCTSAGQMTSSTLPVFAKPGDTDILRSELLFRMRFVNENLNSKGTTFATGLDAASDNAAGDAIFSGGIGGAIWQSNQPTVYIGKTFTDPVVLTRIVVTAVAGNPVPKLLQGSNDNNTWVTIFTIPNEPPDSTFTTYEFASNTPYKYIRLKDSYAGGIYFGLDYLEIWGSVSPVSQAGPGGSTSASDLISGTLADARLSGNIPRLDAASNTFGGSLTAGSVSTAGSVTGFAGHFEGGTVTANYLCTQAFAGFAAMFASFNSSGYIVPIEMEVHADNASAAASNIAVGRPYYTPTGEVRVRV